MNATAAALKRITAKKPIRVQLYVENQYFFSGELFYDDDLNEFVIYKEDIEFVFPPENLYGAVKKPDFYEIFVEV